MRPFLQPARVLYTLFFLSGAAALIYQVVWTRWLTGLLGNASSATAIVLAVFMAGLGIGSWLSSRMADRTERAIRAYAMLELGIVFFVLLPLWEVGWMALVLSKLAVWFGPVSPVLDVARLATAVIAIGPPTVLMGASLPLIVKALASSTDFLGRHTAAAYAANSLGGVVGTLLAGFYLMETFGLRGACLTAAGLGLLAGVAALWLDRRISLASDTLAAALADGAPPRDDRSASRRRKPRRHASTHVVPPGRTKPVRPTIRTHHRAFWILVAASVTGFSALGLETIWCRVLSLLTLNTTYAFSLMLAVLLCGLSLGSWLIGGRLDRMTRPVGWFVAIQTLLSVYALSSLLWAPQVVRLSQWLVPEGGLGLLEPWFGRPLVMALCLLLVPTTLMGASLPIACKLYALLVEDVARPVGRVYAANSFGAVLGSLVIGLVAIPHLGTWWAVVVCASASAAAAAGVGWTYATGRRRPVYTTVAATAAACAVILGIVYGGAAVTRRGLESGDVVRFRCEDEYGLVEVVEDERIGTRRMLTNRLHQEGSTLPHTVLEQRRQGLLPLMLHSSPRRVLEIGLGTGIKLSALQSPLVEEAVVVEISPGVIRASRLFADYNGGIGSPDAGSASKVQVVCADGRNYVALMPQRFDVIVNGLLTPYRAGVARLYTVEHFRACREKLADGGMFVVWVAIRQIAPEDMKVLVRTLLEVFPDTTMWMDGYYLALISTTRPQTFSAEEIERRFSDTAAMQVLDEAGLDSPVGLLATFVAGPQVLDRFSRGRPLNTEDRPIIEFSTPRLGERLNGRELAADNLDVLCSLQEPLCPSYLATDRLSRSRFESAQRARATAREGLIRECRGQHIEAAKLFAEALTYDPTDTLARDELETYMVAHGKECLERGLADQAYKMFLQAIRVNPRSIGAIASLAAMEEAAGYSTEAEQLWRRALFLDPHNRHIQSRLQGLRTAGNPRRY